MKSTYKFKRYGTVIIECLTVFFFAALLIVLAWSKRATSAPGGMNVRFKLTRILQGPQDARRYGHALAGAGDFNGDIFGDYLVGFSPQVNFTPRFTVGYVISGSNAGILQQISSRTGWNPWLISVANSGDIDGDGRPESMASSYSLRGGEIAIYSQNRFFVPITNSAIIPGSKIAAGDLTGDGINDILLSSPYASVLGQFFLYSGAELRQNRILVNSSVITTPANYHYLGEYLVTGNFNDDGYSDVVTTARDSAHITRLITYYGHDVLATVFTPNVTGVHTMPQEAADWNIDGYDDLMIQEVPHPNPFVGTSKISMHLGGPGGLSKSSTISVSGSAADFFGATVADVGDVDCDGRKEILVGAPAYSTGKAYLYSYDHGQNTMTLQQTFQSTSATDGFAKALDAQFLRYEGRVKVTDIIIGAPYANQEKGRVYVYRTRGCGPDMNILQLLPRREEGWQQPKLGEMVYFAVTFQNQGVAQAEPHQLCLYLDGSLFTSIDIPALQVGELQTYALPKAWKATAGTHSVSTTIDCQNRVPENDETNNSLAGTIAVPSPTPAPMKTRTQ